MDLALRDIRQHVGKFLATIAGVAMLLSIVLVMNGIYRGNIADGVWLIEHTGTDLWVVERDRGGPFNEASRLPADAWRSVAAAPGVAQAAPLVLYTAQRRLGGAEQQFTVVGYDVFGGLGGPTALAEGRPIAAAHRELLADRKLRLPLGATVTLSGDAYTVVGLTAGAVDGAGNPLLYMALPDAQQLQFEQDARAAAAARAAALQRLERSGYVGAQAERLLPLLTGAPAQVNAVLVRLQAGADEAAVARHIRQWLHFNVYTTEEERRLMLDGRLARISGVLGLFRALLVAVSIVIIALIVYVLTIEKIRAIATLKLIGAPNRVIVRLILEQSLALTLASFALAWVLRELIAPGFPRTLDFAAHETAITFAVMLAGGIAASGMAIWHALRTPPQLALGG